MRISTSWSQQLGVNALLGQQSKLSKTQLQLASGLKIQQPADDPVGAANILAFKEEIDQTAQYQRNIDTARERNALEESALESAGNIIFRAKELTVQAANSTISDNEKLAIKAEIDQLSENLLSIANTQNANGEYIFAGYLSDSAPFAWDEALGAYEYLGANEQRQIQISPERRLADGDPGFQVFQKIPSDSQEAAVADGNRSIFNTLKSLSDALANTFTPPQAVIQGTKFVETPLDYSITPSSFQLTGDVGSPVTVNLTGTYATIDDLAAAINSTPGLSAAGIQAQTNGHYLEFVSTTEGAGSSIAIDSITGSFATDTGFNDPTTGSGADLQTNQTGELFYTMTDEVLTDLDNALKSFLQARTATGARLKTLDDQESQNEKFMLDLQGTLSDIEDLDYAEAVSRFNLQNTALQAAQQSFSRVQNLSLFNFL